jgi:hypothetical protein
LTAALLLSGCSQVEIKNQRWYGDLGPKGAVYFETLTTATGTVDKASWDTMRVGMACITTDTLAEVKKEIEELCSATPCDYEKVSQALGKFQARIDRFMRRAGTL